LSSKREYAESIKPLAIGQFRMMESEFPSDLLEMALLRFGGPLVICG